MRHTFTEALIQESEWIHADHSFRIAAGKKHGEQYPNNLGYWNYNEPFLGECSVCHLFFPVKKIRRRISCKNTIKVYGDFNFSNYNGIFAVKDNMLDEMVDCALQCRMFLHYLFHSACRK